MSTLQTTNIDFESTGNNQLTYASNSVTLRVGGVGVMTVNTTALTVNVTSAITSGVLSTNGTISVNTLTTSSNSSLIVYGQITTTGTVSPTALAANTIGWAPGITNEAIVRFSGNNDVTLPIYVYGMTAGVNGQIIVLSNIGTKAIIFENESPSETTAGNRFSLPNSITLNGYQSMTVIYDGTSARWKPTDNALVGFTHKSLLTKGFWSGGIFNVTCTVATADRLTYSTEAVAAVTGANLSQARSFPGTAGTICKGFFIGGTAPAPVGASAVADRTTYSTEVTAAVLGANLTTGRTRPRGAGNTCKGFFLADTVANRTTYATEVTALAPGAVLSQSRDGVGAAGNFCKAFYAGGNAPSPLNEVVTTDRVTMATETLAAVTGANLSQARDRLGAAGNQVKGFYSGGTAPNPVGSSATTDRITYATETNAAVPGANLSAGETRVAAAGEDSKGFMLNANFSNRIRYETETTAATPTSILSTNRISTGAV